MPSVSDQLHSRTEASIDDRAHEVFAQREINRRPTSRVLADRRPLRDLRRWAIGGAAAFALVAIISIAVFNAASRSDEHQAQTMGLLMPQKEMVAPKAAPRSDQSAYNGPARESTANKASANVQKDALSTNSYVQTPNSPAPLIARTAGLTILVKDFAAARTSLDTILARYGGYSASLTIDTPENSQRHFQASIRIPENKLTGALNDLKTLGRAVNETQSGEEVTQQHADLVARLQNSRETEQRLRAILEQRTGKIDDVLQVEQEIARVRGEIESMDSEQGALEHRVSFASVDLQLVEEYKEQLNPSPVSTSSRLRNAFIEGIRNASGTLLGLILFLERFAPSILIWAAIFGLPAFLVWRRFKRINAHV
jgi:hypothetical protein